MAKRQSSSKNELSVENDLNGNLEVYGARVHNLKNIDLVIPHNKLVVFTGISGSGKSSLAFDTIYAEGQRRYMETFSAYARQFIGELKRPDVDRIVGLSPVISIAQKTSNRNPRSTVGTITEIYDYLRLLFARVADAYSYVTGEKMIRYSEQQIINLFKEQYDEMEMIILAPLVKGRKGHYRELFENIRRQGFLKVRIDGEIREISFGLQLDRFKIHDIELVIDQLSINSNTHHRLTESVKQGLKHGKGSISVIDTADNTINYYSRLLVCPTSGVSYNDPEPNTFSFNSPYGACHKCNGLGHISEVDIHKIIPHRKKSIKEGGLVPLGPYKNNWIFRQLEAIGHKYEFDLNTAINDISDEALDVILYGSNEVLKIQNDYVGVSSTYSLNYEGIVNFLVNQNSDTASSTSMKKWVNSFMNSIVCPVCNGTRLQKEALYFTVDEKNIAELSELNLRTLIDWLNELPGKLEERKFSIGKEIISEICSRLKFLLDVGLDYLTLSRPAYSLSGGETQRIRLATQIGSQLTNVLYILDEPSIGLHQRDNQRLITSLKNLRDMGNSVIVVEHDKEMILSADYVVDIGPGAGNHGGEIVAKGTPSEMLNCKSLTCGYLSGLKSIKIPETRRAGNGLFINLLGANGHNLKFVNLKLPLGMLICITGVSGSGKSSLINETLYPILSKMFYKSGLHPLAYEKIEGHKHIDKVIEVDQTPIGRTPRSNPVTYIGVFDDIRKLFAQLPESLIRGYLPGRFSFNVKGGRCETCGGAGLKTIEMNFLPDVYVSCDACNGMRYNRETLEIRYRNKSINDVLNLTVEQAVGFFENIPSIQFKIKALQDVGLGYLTLGHASTLLSGGEAQRIKLAAELTRKDSGQTLYILDEPTTGLHFEDINMLMKVLNKLVDKGNTIIIIEHNLDVIKMADHIIDLGPEGGDLGGYIIAEGTPEEVAQSDKGFTAAYLKEELEQGRG
ncbi:MAG: excinuclease ABC subunit UvrA [Bacteroidota bacterium]